MWKADLDLIRDLSARYGPFPQPIVDVGGLERPCLADYEVTIDLMAKVNEDVLAGRITDEDVEREAIAAAQIARYKQWSEKDPPVLQNVVGRYTCENPETGGKAIEELPANTIGTAICLSTLEHVRDPFEAVAKLAGAIKQGGLCIVSVPFAFPHHPSPEDNWRFSPSGLRNLFWQRDWQILECPDIFRPDIPASAGVRCIRTGEPQEIRGCWLIARKV